MSLDHEITLNHSWTTFLWVCLPVQKLGNHQKRLMLAVSRLCIEARKSGERWSVSWWWTTNWWCAHRIGTQNSWTSSSAEASWSEWSWPSRSIPPWPRPSRKTWCAWWLSSQPCGHFGAQAYLPGRMARLQCHQKLRPYQRDHRWCYCPPYPWGLRHHPKR